MKSSVPSENSERSKTISAPENLASLIRSFGSFQAAASEAALCRIFAGQYTMIDLGRQLGRHSGDFGLGHFGHSASRRSLRKAHSRSQARPARMAPAAAAQVKG